MKRKLGILFSFLSLICCIAFALFWIRSYSYWDAIDWQRGDHKLQVRSKNGKVCFQRAWRQYRPAEWSFRHRSWSPPPPIDWSKSPIPYTDVLIGGGLNLDNEIFWDRFSWDPQRIFQCAGFEAYKSGDVRRRGCWAINTPYWFWCILTSVLPIMSSSRTLLRRGRIKRGRCPNCNYDLRATPISCPECGLAFRT